jgi:hypothetical protein
MSSFTELKTITQTLRDYFDEVTKNLVSVGNALPSFEDFEAPLAYDMILTEAQQSSDRAASYSVGALVDSVYFTAAVLREFGMRTKTKAQYYQDADIDSGLTVDYIDGLYGRYLNYYRGTSPEQHSGNT